MRIILMAFCFLVISGNVLAQSQNGKASGKKGNSTTISQNKALIIVDGIVISKEALMKIDPKGISSIDVLNGKSAVVLFGPKAINGAVILTTKGSLARRASKMQTKGDSAASAKDSTLYVIDGVKHFGTPDISRDSIAELSVAIDKNAVFLQYGKDAKYGLVVINTVQAQITVYQHKFGEVCKEYKDYLEKNDAAKDAIIYVIDNELLMGEKKERAAKLTKIKATEIKKATFKIAEDINGKKLIIPTFTITTITN